MIQELLAGATDRLKRAVVEGLYRPFVRNGRIVTPTHSVWEEAGRLLGIMRGQRKDQIDRLTGSFVNDLLSMEFSDEDIMAFHESIEKSFPHSIDEFLSDRPEFIEIGRATIAQIIIGCEDEKRLRERERNWYGLLRDRIKAEVLKNQFSPVIATFNYDLSLDKFLYDFFSSTFPRYAKLKTLEEAIRIFHVHGRLGRLDYEESQWCRSYGKSISPMELRNASQGIRVVSELDNGFGRGMVFAQKAIDEAEKVIFLGFGYDDLNLNRLRVSSWKIGKFFGTALNLDRERREQLLQRTQKRITLAKSDVEIYDYLQTAECWKY